MKEIKITQDDSGKITVESTGPDGEAISTTAESVDAVIDLLCERGILNDRRLENRD